MPCEVTNEELSRFAASELAPNEAAAVEDHLRSCEGCRRRLRALRALDIALSELPRLEPSAEALLHTRRALSAEVRAVPPPPELMTLGDVADTLRISLDELEEIVLDLPAFELAGQLRVRRGKLVEWIEARERAWARSSAQSEAARLLSNAI